MLLKEKKNVNDDLKYTRCKWTKILSRTQRIQTVATWYAQEVYAYVRSVNICCCIFLICCYVLVNRYCIFPRFPDIGTGKFLIPINVWYMPCTNARVYVMVLRPIGIWCWTNDDMYVLGIVWLLQGQWTNQIHNANRVVLFNCTLLKRRLTTSGLFY